MQSETVERLKIIKEWCEKLASNDTLSIELRGAAHAHAYTCHQMITQFEVGAWLNRIQYSIDYAADFIAAHPDVADRAKCDAAHDCAMYMIEHDLMRVTIQEKPLERKVIYTYKLAILHDKQVDTGKPIHVMY
jgi:hypothetical protein